MWAGEWPNVVNLERVHTVRIVVVGAPGTGKTTLCQAICGDADALGRSAPTVGCDVHVAAGSRDAGTGRFCLDPKRGQPVFVELYDTGGAAKYEDIRRTLAAQADGVILVHAASSGYGLDRYLREQWALLGEGPPRTSGSAPQPPPRLPTLTVGTMADKTGRAGLVTRLLPAGVAQQIDRVLSWARSEVGRLVPAGLVASRSRRWLDAGSDGGLPLFDTEGKLPGCVAGDFHMRCAPITGLLDMHVLQEFLDRALRHSEGRPPSEASAGGAQDLATGLSRAAADTATALVRRTAFQQEPASRHGQATHAGGGQWARDDGGGAGPVPGRPHAAPGAPQGFAGVGGRGPGPAGVLGSGGWSAYAVHNRWDTRGHSLGYGDGQGRLRLDDDAGMA